MPQVDITMSLAEGSNANLSPEDLALFLIQVQAGILRGHGRNFSRVLLLKLPEAPEVARSSLAAIAGGHLTGFQITTAADQMVQSANYKAALLTDALPLPEAVQSIWVTFRCAARAGLSCPKNGAFESGMASRQAILNDPPETVLEAAYLEADVFVSISADAEDLLDRAVAIASTPGTGALGDVKLLHVERCAAIRAADGSLREPFGFADGVSDLDFWRTPSLPETSDPSAPLSQVLVPEPTGGYGSFVVLRKLSQDSVMFDTAVRQIAASVCSGAPTAQQLVDIAQSMIGRTRDGSPLVGANPSSKNAFDYGADPSGVACPFFAHIRKANPRGGSRFESLESERSHRIARRGIPLDPRAGMTGLLFACFQSDIENQFEFIQRTWITNPDFPRAGAGTDLLSARAGNVTWPRPAAPPLHVGVVEFTRLVAGAYLYAPSPAALRGV